jgi:hypothetical protein
VVKSFRAVSAYRQRKKTAWIREEFNPFGVLGRVFVSAGNWLRLIRERGRRRPRTRVHPARPKQGVRATKPNEYWHIDVTIIKLLDGTKVYLHAVIYKLSRRILAWKVALRFEPQNTCAVLFEAGKTLPPEEDPATVVAYSGVENVNGAVGALLGLGRLRRVLAQVEVDLSNSTIEAFWRSMNHNWLCRTNSTRRQPSSALSRST